MSKKIELNIEILHRLMLTKSISQIACENGISRWTIYNKLREDEERKRTEAEKRQIKKAKQEEKARKAAEAAAEEKRKSEEETRRQTAARIWNSYGPF